MGSVRKRLPSIRSYEETSTEYVRYGSNNAIYVVEGPGTQGKGAHASVMKVKNVSTGEYFGAKEPYYKTSDNADIARKRLEALQMEYEHIKRLDHPHIVKAFELVVAEDITLSPWMIVEYIPLNLGEALSGLSAGERLITMTHLSSALSYMHTSGVTHRDLKPDNALVVKRPRELVVKLADFGTSKQNESAKMETFTGTEIYMAPELFKKPRLYTNKVDMWALGLVGMLLFTDWDPDTDDLWDPSDFPNWIRNTALPEIERAPDFLQPMIKGLLRKDTRRRWSPSKCLKWLWQQKSTGAADGLSMSDTGSTMVKKRPASRDLQLMGSVDEDRNRLRRSANPTLSSARVRVSEPQEESSLPDTASPSYRWPDALSTASTPQIDIGTFEPDEPDDDDAESSGADTDLQEWQ